MSNQIKCPNCNEVFSVDESSYIKILNQIKNDEFFKEVKKREEDFKKIAKSEYDIKIKDIETKLEFQKKENENIRNENSNNQKLIEKTTQEKYVSKINDLEKEIYEYKNANEILSMRLENEIQTIKKENDLNNEIKKKDLENKFEKELSKKENEIVEYKNILKSTNDKNELEVKKIREDLENKLREKDIEIDYYKDLKARLSTKMVGETLEKHCENEFNKIRTVAFKNAYFEKDNDTSEGTKGDYIFKDFSDDNIEYISIMFEMKNELDETKTKKKNEDFLAKLHKDREKKGCEYAVLVSLLESDNEYYNTGIVDMSYKYPKMYVIRPQFFIPLITLLVNASKNSIQYKRELIGYQNQNIDISKLEEDLEGFKNDLKINSDRFKNNFNNAIIEIDTAIKKLQDTKESLIKCNNNLNIANGKADKMTIQKLTKNNPTAKRLLEEAKKGAEK